MTKKEEVRLRELAPQDELAMIMREAHVSVESAFQAPQRPDLRIR